MDILTLSAQQLRKAADLQEQIQALQRELASLLGGAEEEAQPGAPGTPTKRKMSAAGRARIAAAAKARWAKLRKEKGAAPGKLAVKPKGKMSAGAKARLSALAKARWAKAKKEGKSKL
jgi:hypothetical protein